VLLFVTPYQLPTGHVTQSMSSDRFGLRHEQNDILADNVVNLRRSAV